MKKLMTVCMALAAGVALAQGGSLAEARAKIADVVSDKVLMGSTIKDLSAADQRTFLADVNAAISKLPAPIEERGEKFLDANTAAMKSAQKGNLGDLLAETFATVPPEILTEVNERFATSLFNRAADPSVTFTDEQYVDTAKKIMSKVHARNASADNSAVRDTFAILMFVRASNGTPADLKDTLVQMLDEDAQDIAKNEWIPAALGIDQEKTYAPMLGILGTGRQPVLVVNDAQTLDALFIDLTDGIDFPTRNNAFRAAQALDTLSQMHANGLMRVDDDYGIDRLPRLRRREGGDEYGPNDARGGLWGVWCREPHGYPGQTIE